MSWEPRIETTELPGGGLVVTESWPGVRTAAFRACLRHGSRDESAAENGLSHLLEHLVFRGTSPRAAGRPGRSGNDIAAESDLLGGEVDAYTTREFTVYGVETVADVLPRGVELVMDLVARHTLRSGDLVLEKAVILEEIRSFEDSPEDAAWELAAASCWPDHPLGRPIQGTRGSVDAFTPEMVRAFWDARHVGANVLACAAGAVDHRAIVALVEEGLDGRPTGRRLAGPPSSEMAAGVRVERWERVEQSQVLVSIPGLPEADAGIPTLEVLVTWLGGGVSSRLWQRIREREGLCYDLSLGLASLHDTGRIVFEAGTAPENLNRLLALHDEELRRAVREGPTDTELERALGYLRGGVLLGMEGPGARVDALVESMLVHGRHVPTDELLAQLAAVDRDAVVAACERFLGSPRRNLVVVGPESTPDPDGDW